MNEFLVRLPSTNFRVFVGVCLSALFVVGTMAAGLIEGLTGKDVLPPLDYIEALRTFVLGLLGLDTIHFAAKRLTHKEPSGGAEP